MYFVKFNIFMYFDATFRSRSAFIKNSHSDRHPIHFYIFHRGKSKNTSFWVFIHILFWNRTLYQKWVERVRFYSRDIIHFWLLLWNSEYRWKYWFSWFFKSIKSYSNTKTVKNDQSKRRPKSCCPGTHVFYPFNEERTNAMLTILAYICYFGCQCV